MTSVGTSYFDNAALALLRPVILTVAVLVSVFAVFNAIGDPDHAIIPILDVAVLAGCALVWLQVRHDRLPASWAHGVSASLGLAIVFATLVRFHLTADRICTLHVMMEMVAFGVVSLSRRWLRWCMVAITAGWLVASASSMSGRTYVEYALAVVGAGALANLAFEVRIRSLLHNAELVVKGDQARAALEDALALTRQALADRIQAEAHGELLREQLARSQKIEAIGLLAGGLAHDVNNVLQCIGALAETLCEDLPPDSSHHQDATVILSQAKAASTLTKNLLVFGRSHTERREDIDLDGVLNNVVRLVVRAFPRHTSIEQCTGHGDANVKGDPAQLGHALVNLCINASDAMADGGTIELATARVRLDDTAGKQLGAQPGSYVVIRVSDQGCGMDDATKRRAFEPFFTTKSVEKGTGLGLAMVLRTMQRHGGVVTVDSDLGRGTTVSLYLPSS
jgi:signal transduction histidine kinase